MKKSLAGIMVLGMLVGAGACAKKGPVVDPTTVQHQLDRAHAAVAQAEAVITKVATVEGQLHDAGIIPEGVHTIVTTDTQKADAAVKELDAKIPATAAEVRDAAIAAAQKALNSLADKMEATGNAQLADLATQVRLAATLVAFIL